MAVGFDHIGSLIITLVLAYAGEAYRCSADLGGLNDGWSRAKSRIDRYGNRSCAGRFDWSDPGRANCDILGSGPVCGSRFPGVDNVHRMFEPAHCAPVSNCWPMRRHTITRRFEVDGQPEGVS